MSESPSRSSPGSINEIKTTKEAKSSEKQEKTSAVNVVENGLLGSEQPLVLLEPLTAKVVVKSSISD